MSVMDLDEKIMLVQGQIQNQQSALKELSSLLDALLREKEQATSTVLRSVPNSFTTEDLDTLTYQRIALPDQFSVSKNDVFTPKVKSPPGWLRVAVVYANHAELTKRFTVLQNTGCFCGAKLIQRTNKQNKQQFWCCERYCDYGVAFRFEEFKLMANVPRRSAA